MLCLSLCAGVVPPSISLGRALWEGSEGYKAGIAVVRQAATAQDLTMLLKMEDVMTMLDQAGKHNASATRNGNLVYAAYIFFFMASCIVPGLILAQFVNKKISRLQDKQCERDVCRAVFKDKQSSTSNSTSGDLWAKRSKRDFDLQTDIERSALPAPSGGPNRSRTSQFPAQPKDRPFAGLVKVETPALPSRFNDILEDKRHTSEERALRLKRVLQSDMRFLAAYTLLLCAYAGMTVFESSKGQLILSARQDLELSLAFPTWNFIVPGLIVSFTFLYDALRYRDGEDGFSPSPRQPSPRFTAPAVSAIQCSQLVNVVYSEEVKDVEKMSSSEPDEELQESLSH